MPLTTIYYDTGFLIGLKGFTAAIIGGLASYPVAALAALAVGVLESFSSFWASAFKEVIVFTAIIPVLLWRSLRGRRVGGRGMSAARPRGRCSALLLCVAAALAARLPPFWVTLANYIGICRHRRHRPGGADRRRRHDLVRPGELRRLRRLHDRHPDRARPAISPWLTLPAALAGQRAWRRWRSARSRCGCPAITCRSAPSPGR